MKASLIWTEFLNLLANNEMTSDNIRPYHEALTEPVLSFLRNLKPKILHNNNEIIPLIYEVGNNVHFIVSLSDDDYCLTFIIDNESWFFRHAECIFIRLDKVEAPTSSFPDISKDHKDWIRQEIDATNKVQIYNLLSVEKGREYALDWFKDGKGYFLAACTWVPFVAPEKAFILYLCWEQSNLIGNEVLLEKLENSKVTIKMKPLYFEVYKRAGHLKQQIAFEDYISIFNTIWHDRAVKAGWKLDISYLEEECILQFYK